jgi:nitrate/nitrite transporter NarK
VLKETGLSILTVGFLSAVPYAVGARLMILVAWNSDRTQERKWHMISATATAGIILMLASLVPQGSTIAILLCLTLSVGAFLGRFGPFWTLPTEIHPPDVAGVGIGLINGGRQFGRHGRAVFLRLCPDDDRQLFIAFAVGGPSLVVGSLIAVPIRGRP